MQLLFLYHEESLSIKLVIYLFVQVCIAAYSTACSAVCHREVGSQARVLCVDGGHSGQASWRGVPRGEQGSRHGEGLEAQLLFRKQHKIQFILLPHLIIKKRDEDYFSTFYCSCR